MAVNEKTERLNYRAHVSEANEAIRTTLSVSCNPVVTTKFTETSAALLHLVTRMRPDIPVIWVDTGYNTRATLVFCKDVCAQLNLSLHTYRPESHVLTVPPELDSPQHDDFVRQVKLEPFQRALSELKPDAWLSSIRRYQSGHRRQLAIFDEMADGLLKVSPLLNWSAESVHRYCQDNDLPTGPPCYDPTKGEPMRECGLHLDQVSQPQFNDSPLQAPM